MRTRFVVYFHDEAPLLISAVEQVELRAPVTHELSQLVRQPLQQCGWWATGFGILRDRFLSFTGKQTAQKTHTLRGTGLLANRECLRILKIGEREKRDRKIILVRCAGNRFQLHVGQSIARSLIQTTRSGRINDHLLAKSHW